MKNKQDIEKLFRDNEHKLDERPSERAWNRLESKLDGNTAISSGTKGRQRPMYRIMGMAATLLFLVAMVTLMTTMFRNQESNMTASAEPMTPQVMEELKHYDDQKGVYTIAVSYQRYLNQSPREFAEGAVNKKLIPPPKGKTMASKKLLAEAKPLPKEETDDIAKDVLKPIESRNTTPQEIEIKEREQIETYAGAGDVQAAPITSAPIPTAMEETSPIAETIDAEAGNVLAEAYQVEPPVSQNYPKQSNSRAKAQQTYADQATEAMTQLDVSSNTIDYNGNANLAGVEQFQWLIGQWQAPLGSNKKTIEEWVQQDEFTIAGSGQLVVNGDTTFTEGMKIQKIGDELYYILAVDQNQKEVKFKLRSVAPSMAVFETEETGVPNQLILQQYSANNFSTTLQNAAPQEIQQSQIQYLQNRNNVELNQRTTRNMSRAGMK